MGNFKVAVVGVGGRGEDHANSLKARKDVDLVAICDINEELGKKLAAKYQTKYYHNYNDLLEKEKLDAVFIATPHYLHAPITVAAAEHEINIFCEKPMALNLHQCDEMIQACRKYGVKLAIGLQKRYSNEFQYLYNAIRGAKGKNGDLGRITDVSMIARHHRNEMYYIASSMVDPEIGPRVPPGPWRGRWITEGGGAIINQAIHNIDILRWICGPFKSLTAYGTTISDEHKFIEVEDTVSITFELMNGAVGTCIISSCNKKSEENRIAVHGTDGYIELKGGYAGDVITKDTRYTTDDEYELPLVSDPNELDQITNFFTAIKEDKEPKVNGEIGRQSIEIMRAILKSIQIEGSVNFPLHDTVGFPNIHNVNLYKE